LGVRAQKAIAYRVKRAAPKLRQFLSKQIRYASHHFAGGFVGEGKQQYPVGRNPLL